MAAPPYPTDYSSDDVLASIGSFGTALRLDVTGAFAAFVLLSCCPIDYKSLEKGESGPLRGDLY
jgi:hypothetical protein